MKLILSILLFFSISLAASQSAVRSFNAWQVTEQDEQSIISTPGYFSQTRHLSLVPVEGCTKMAMRLLWDTFDPNVNGYLHRGDHINFVVKIDDAAAMNTAFELLSMHAGSGGVSLLLESPALSDTLISRLKQGYEIRFEITGSRGFVNTFDLKSDYFSLSGFTAAYRALKQRCIIIQKEQ